jgi:CDP-diacylglycerol---glycerol-3-phosphate 3-phosphatidyltransferase
MTDDTTAQPNFRGRARAAVEPLALVFGRLGLTPNALTLIGFGIAVFGALLAATQSWLAAGFVVLFGAAFDMFDGALARATNKASKLGAFMDSTFDRAGEAIVYVGLVAGLAVLADIPSGTPWLIVGPLTAAAAMAAAFMVSYARAKSEGLGFTSGRGMASVGLAPREVRTAILGVGLIAAGIFETSRVADYPADVVPGPQAWWIVLVGALGLITILATFTVIQRIVHVVREARRQEQ